MAATKEAAAVMMQERGKENQSGTYFTINILVEILVRLPVSSVLRLRSVCKQWRDIIGKRHFMAAHLKHTQEHKSQTTKTLMFLQSIYRDDPIRGDGRPARAVVFDELERYPRCLWTASSPGADIRMIDTCNGLLCLYDKGKDVIMLANPVTGESLALPMPERMLGRATYLCNTHKYDTYSFGFHPTTQQYKIISFPCYDGTASKFDTVQVYTLGDKSWREVVTPGASCSVYSGVVSVNGATYWFTESVDQIMSFDLKAEHVSSIKLPAVEESESFAIFDLTADVNTGRLCAAATVHQHIDIKVKIWFLEDGTEQRWSRQYSVLVHRHRWQWMYAAEPHFVHGEHLLMWAVEDDCFYAYKLREKGLVLIDGERIGTQLNDSVEFSWVDGIRTFVYLESFTPLNIYGGLN